ncbi:MAG TPA: AAA family ATPase [Chloroflexota bacterium]|nr:AAA family ATPase [Chloroflexota bacterium]
MERLNKLQLRGFKSIRDLPELTFGPLNVLIGANGAGKSNLISFFKLLNWMTAGSGNLQVYIQQAGGASTFLYDGPPVTPQVEAALTLENDDGINEYTMRLFHAAPDTFIFADERIRFSHHGLPTQANWKPLGSGNRETGLINAALERKTTTGKTAGVILGLMRRCVVHQFHNTSATARVRQRWSLEDSRYLKEDAANLAPFLLRLRESEPRAYQRIVETVREIVPFFSDFVLEPILGSVILQWQERGSDVVFGAHQASDGMLRAMALVSLLLQPEDNLPSVVILDEPELGLHPYAINILAGLLQSVSTHTQVIVATQSMNLIDYFTPEEIVVVDRVDRESKFRRLDPEPLDDWLDEYSLGELWEKNVLGGRPA